MPLMATMTIPVATIPMTAYASKKCQRSNVILVMHKLHFYISQLPHYSIPIVQLWEDGGILYSTSQVCNDDWFWLHADLWYGKGTLAVMND